MKSCLINKITVLIILFSGALVSFSRAQNNTALEGQIKKSDGILLGKEKVLLINADKKTTADSTFTDSTGFFRFKNFPLGNYMVGLRVEGVDNSIADVIKINILNPAKRNQHFKIEDGSLVCIESNYSNIKDALENRENVYELNLNSLQHDVAEKSLAIGNDGSKKLSPKIGEFVNLEFLSIDLNTINTLPAEIGKLIKLGTLSANLNKLNALPAEMENLKYLRALNLGKNDFHQLPDLITKYAGLEVLNFEGNPIAEVPATINSLKSLKELNLGSCFEITALPIQLGDLSNLEVLNLSKCAKLKSLPEEICNLKNLKVLDVTGTKISTKRFQEAVPGCEIRK